MELPPLHGLDVDRVLHAAPAPVLLVITRAGCGACRAVKAAFAALDPNGALAGLLAYEVDATDAPALVEELGVFHLPALWLYRGGEPVAEVAGATTPARLEAALRAALAGSEGD